MKIVAHGNDSGSKNWRLLNPFKYLRQKGIQAYVSDRGINEEEAMWADINIVQSVTDKDGIALLYRLQQENGKNAQQSVLPFPVRNTSGHCGKI